MIMKTVDVIIPVYKPDEKLIKLINMLEKQTVKPEQIIIANTGRKYFDTFVKKNNVETLFRKIRVFHVTQREFDHGGTRREAAKRSKADAMLFMTDDAVPGDEYLIERLLDSLSRKGVAVSYARQLPREKASAEEVFSRKFNYPSESRIKSEDDLPSLGIKTYFCSNVCAMYNREIYDELGGFVKNTIFNEDMIYAGNACKKGYKIAYRSDALVIHSHSYSGWQQLKRNFDLGVSQREHPEIFKGIPSEKEGKKLVKEETAFLWNTGRKLLIIPFYFRCFCKYTGYLLGKHYDFLPEAVILFCTGNRYYFIRKWNNVPSIDKKH